MFSYELWLKQPITVRHEIAARFYIPKRRSTHVVNNEVADDGYDLKELTQILCLKNLQVYLHSEIPEYKPLWDALVSQVTGIPIEIPMSVVIEPTEGPKDVVVEPTITVKKQIHAKGIKAKK